MYAVNWEHDDDTALLVLEGTDFNSGMVSMRQQPVEIIIASYTGLSVPKSALRVEEWTDSNGEKHKDTGVFILSGSVRKFKRPMTAISSSRVQPIRICWSSRIRSLSEEQI